MLNPDKKTAQVQIPKPCHEDWNAMTPKEKGRHCDSCAKMVVDFTKMSDRELINHLHKGSDGICGRFRKDQLTRPMPISKPERMWSFPRFLATTSAALFAALGSAIATVTHQASPVEVTETQHGGIRLDHPEKKTFFGTVTSDGMPIKGVEVSFVGFSIDPVKTDSGGHYFMNINWPEESEGLQIQFTHPEYQTHIVSADSIAGSLNVTLFPIIELIEMPEFMGKVMMGESIIIELEEIEEKVIEPGQEKVYDKDGTGN